MKKVFTLITCYRTVLTWHRWDDPWPTEEANLSIVRIIHSLNRWYHKVRYLTGGWFSQKDRVSIFDLSPSSFKGVLLLHERNWLNYFMLNIERAVTNEKERCRYVLTSTTYLTRSLSFAFPKHSLLPHIFNEEYVMTSVSFLSWDQQVFHTENTRVLLTVSCCT